MFRSEKPQVDLSMLPPDIAVSSSALGSSSPRSKIRTWTSTTAALSPRMLSAGAAAPTFFQGSRSG